MVPFYKPYNTNYSEKYIKQVLDNGHLSGDGLFTAKCAKVIGDLLSVEDVLMTTSCTKALEMATQLIDLSEGDEVIVPSFTYPSTANAVILAGGKVVYCEVEASHLTMDPVRLKMHITDKTKAILVVHYGGIACDMDEIMTIVREHGLYVIEDVAQGFMSTYQNRALGTIGDFGCFSFHNTKDIVSGEGGALIVNNKKFLEKAISYRLKGTNQASFSKGLVPFYEWVSEGTSASPSELLMAMLYGQLQLAGDIIAGKQKLFTRYERYFDQHNYNGIVSYSKEADGSRSNGHLFYLIFKSLELAERFIGYMKEYEVAVYTHFVPLHESPMGRVFVRENNEFIIEKQLGKRLVRLPLFAKMTEAEQCDVLTCVGTFFGGL